ncbi:MAG: hypothetical protein H0V70_09655 [Ktedonobacteraceae bacterium]|nr:hypothetical protein [Ktedonobacteraceae bacterium]
MKNQFYWPECDSRPGGRRFYPLPHDIDLQIGITSTPVIDLATSILYSEVRINW